MTKLALYKKTDGTPDKTMTAAQAKRLLVRLGDRVSLPYESDDDEYQVYEVYDEGEKSDDYPDGDPYADSIWLPY